ncbi:putative lateral flagellar export/assembly protein LafU [Buttiauxella warmboldiae]|uniref:Putative lateral flagellar export/assembly protein LafU n=1 Tax=Buttiauxella warmboldiae TaxID=82993 RepID=A0A3N5E350_9ENTR|nr:putative lateral flagellar export/assembly protein LafU [Buttiauxella warmboldiae]RPH29429.1 putative lateral flagellar export/assembly protein LafU [Buttiauxella warmboldiae]
MRSKKQAHTTIIKRSARREHHAPHGGAWKVAFADFTLAMMALFMVLWIMSSVTEEERKEVVAHLTGESIFDGMVMSPLSSGGQAMNGPNMIIPGKQGGAPTTEEIAQQLEKLDLASKATESLEDVNKRSQQEMIELARVIMEITKAFDAQSNLDMEIVPQGLRILVQDDQKREMFQRSSAILTPFFQRLLTQLAPVFNKIDNKVIITGHTDSSMYRDQTRYNNWNLSGDRALAARISLEQGGMVKDKVIQVNAMADRMLLKPDQPLSAANRRIEIMVLTHAAADSLYQFFGTHGIDVARPADSAQSAQ